jgi:hypothetical protein
MARDELSYVPVTILMADDDEEDCELVRDAVEDSSLAKAMRFVLDGQQLVAAEPVGVEGYVQMPSLSVVGDRGVDRAQAARRASAI